MTSWIPVGLIALVAIAIVRSIHRAHGMVRDLSRRLADPAALESLIAAADVPEAKRAELETALRRALELGQKVEAIKVFRDYSGQGLRESKHAVDRFVASAPISPSGSSPSPLAPGPLEQEPGADGWRMALALAVAIAGAAAYFALSG